MQPLPHQYRVRAEARDTGALAVRSESLPDLAVAAPAEFDGPGDQWSPETMLAAAVASCLVLTFRAIAKASRLAWSSMECAVDATLDKVEGGYRFTAFAIRADVTVPADTDEARVRRLVEKAEKGCIVTNSLRGDTRLEVRVTTAPAS